MIYLILVILKMTKKNSRRKKNVRVVCGDEERKVCNKTNQEVANKLNEIKIITQRKNKDNYWGFESCWSDLSTLIDSPIDRKMRISKSGAAIREVMRYQIN
jgi:hypothetical protein